MGDDQGLLPHRDDRRLVSLVHPPDWTNPTARSRDDVLGLGGGTAGLVSALGAACLGARAALCERAELKSVLSVQR